jgi:hypothetical protein
MSDIKSNKLPVKIIANSAETFAKLEAIIKKLPEGFIKQFDTVEEQGLTGTTVFKSRPLSGEFFCIGNIVHLVQEEEVEYLSSLLDKYVIRTEVTVEGKKKDILWLEVLMYESSKLKLSASTDFQLK